MKKEMMKKVGIVVITVIATALIILGIRLGINGFRFDQIDWQSICFNTLKADAVAYLGYIACKEAKAEAIS